jgi:integrase
MTKDLVRDFFDHIRRDKYETTYNNYVTKIRQMLKAIGKADLMEGIEHIRERRRPARYFQQFQIKRLSKAISEADPELWLFVQFIYYCFIRPNELRHLRAEHILIESNQIYIPGEVSKNGKSEYVSIPNAFRPKLAFIKEMSPSKFLFPADRDITKPCSVNKMWLRHDKHLKKLNFGKGFTLYSWKHTGAIQAVKAGVGVKELQIQLRHHSLDQVNEYLRQMGVWDLQKLQEIFPEI